MQNGTMNVIMLALAIALVLGSVKTVHAVEGAIEINQERAMAGCITPGDTPGFPVTIDESGSYQLTSNLTVPNADTTGIEVVAKFVTLDLNGLAILGPTACTEDRSELRCEPTGVGNGIAGRESTTVLNGTVKGMGQHGILLLSLGTPRGPRVERVHALSNGANGIDVRTHGIVTRNIAAMNGGAGIFGSGGVVTDNLVVRNRLTGIEVTGGIVLSNHVSANGGFGLHITSGEGGYANNDFNRNDGNDTGLQVKFGKQIRGNSCGASSCP